MSNNKKPEVPMAIGVSKGVNSIVSAHNINMQRLIRAASFPSDPQLNKEARRKYVELLAETVEQVIAALNPAIVLEIGAHEASFSRRMAKRLSGSRIVAFEANPDIHKRYRDKVLGSGVEFIHACVSNTTEPIRFNVPIKHDRIKTTMGSILFDSQAHDHTSYEVNAVVIDEFLSASPGINAMWIDVEGAIKIVLDGARETLKNCVALFVELETVERWPGQALAHDVIPMLTDAGLIPLLADNQREWQFNVLFVRPEALRDPRIVQACNNYVEGVQPA